MDFVLFLLGVLDVLSRLLAATGYVQQLLGAISFMIMSFLGMPM